MTIDRLNEIRCYLKKVHESIDVNIARELLVEVDKLMDEREEAMERLAEEYSGLSSIGEEE